jgi:hypothetical protein
LAHQHLGVEMLKTGNAATARRSLERCIALGLTNSGVLAHLAVALNEVGDAAALHHLVDLERLIVPTTIDDLGDFESLAVFNAALAEQVIGNTTAHTDKTTVNGLDTAEFIASDVPCIAVLRRFIYRQIEARRRTALAEQALHPFSLTAPARWRTESWGLRLWRQGYQVAHIHQKAWLSGVYYVQLPDVVDASSNVDRHEGWIEFGRGPDDLPTASRPETRLIQPVPGLMLTFPSYFWHRTVPFDAGRDRISVAFDVIAVA